MWSYGLFHLLVHNIYIILFYFLVVLCEEALVVGAASEPVHFDLSADESNFPISPLEPFPLYTLERPVS